MSDYAKLSQRLVDALELATSPVAVTFLDESLPGPLPSTPVPAGCSFWELGTRGMVATNAEHHKFCSIGVHTHNLAGAQPSQQHELEVTLAAMQGLDYVRSQEVESLPVLSNRNSSVVYWPLGEATDFSPSVVLLFAHAAQGLIISEALSRVDGTPPLAMGRPACALIPQVLNGARSAASLGCCGARAYLDLLDDDIALWGLFGEKLESYIDEIEVLANANSVLRRFHEVRRTEVESGGAPTVEQSLERLS